MENIKTLEHLLNGNHLSDSELEQADKLVHSLSVELNQRKKSKVKASDNTKKYPTQFAAETMKDWMNMMNEFYLGGCGDEIRQAIKKCEDIRIELHQKIFNENSPWGIRINKKDKAEVYWDDQKAEKLNL